MSVIFSCAIWTATTERQLSIRSRHLSSYRRIWANVCIPATAWQPVTTAIGAEPWAPSGAERPFQRLHNGRATNLDRPIPNVRAARGYLFVGCEAGPGAVALETGCFLRMDEVAGCRGIALAQTQYERIVSA